MDIKPCNICIDTSTAMSGNLRMDIYFYAHIKNYDLAVLANKSYKALMEAMPELSIKAIDIHSTSALVKFTIYIYSGCKVEDDYNKVYLEKAQIYTKKIEDILTKVYNE